MAKICKFQLEKRQVSYDCGEIWEDTGEKRKIDGQEPVERYSPDCGWSDSFLYRWIEDADDYVCVGYHRYTKKHQEVSYNLGEDWEVVQGSEQPGVLVEKFSSDCCQLRTVSGETCDEEYRHVNISIEEASLDGDNWIQTGRYSGNTYSLPYALECISGTCLEEIYFPTSATTEYSAYTTNKANMVRYYNDRVVVNMGCYGCGINGIARDAFSGDEMTELVLPEMCHHLGWTICKGLTSLSSVTFNTWYMYNTTTPTSMQNDYGQFSGCTALQTVTFPNDYNGVIYEDMFVGCTSLTSVTLGNPTVIGQGAFAGCSSLSSITLGDSISSIGECAFGCNNNTLTDVYIYSLNDVSCGTKAIPSGATIHVPCEKYAYWDNLYPGQVVGNGCGGERTISGATYCVNNDLYVDVYSQTSYDGETWWTTATTVTLVEQGSGQCSGSYRFKVTFRDSEEETTECSATTVPSYSGNTNIASVSVGNCTTTIPDNEFRNCYYITGVDISNSVTTIGDNVFYGCSRLTSIDIPDSVTSIGDYAFNYCTGLTSCTIGSGITSVGRYAFTNCTSLTSISMAGGGTNCTINERAFNGCSGLTSCTIGNGVTIIDKYAFFSCSGLTSIDIPNSITSIDIQAFYNCRLRSCTIGSGITSIGNSAFYSNNRTPNVTILATTPPTLGYNVFNSTHTFTIYVPSESVEAYKTASNWSTYASKIQAIPSENDEDDND